MCMAEQTAGTYSINVGHARPRCSSSALFLAARNMGPAIMTNSRRAPGIPLKNPYPAIAYAAGVCEM